MASQDRSGHFSTELFEHHQRSERALVGALAEGTFGWREGVEQFTALRLRRRHDFAAGR